MIALSNVQLVANTGKVKKEIFKRLSMTVPSDRKTAILVKSGEIRQGLVQLICGSKEPDSGSIERYARVSYPMGFSAGLYVKLTVIGNISFVAKLFGIDRRSFVDVVVPLLGDDPHLDVDLGDLPQTFRSHLAYCLSYAIPFDVYVANGGLLPADALARVLLKPLVDERLRTAGLILVTSSPPIAQQVCDQAAVLHDEHLTYFPSIKAAAAFFRQIEAETPSEPGDFPR